MWVFTRYEWLKGLAMLGPTLIVMGLTVGVPFLLMMMMSLWTQVGFGFADTWSLTNYRLLFTEPIYFALMSRSIAISAVATIVTVMLAYPMAYYLAFHVHRNKILWLIVIMVPFWSSYLLRVFAWRVILGYEGVINSGLQEIGLIDEPLAFLLYSRTAVTITLAHAWAAFAFLPIYVSMEKIDRSVLEAAADLGEPPHMRFFRIVLPLSMPGVIAGTLLMFIPTVGDYVTPTLVGGPDSRMIGTLIQLQFGAINNWPMGAALSLAMLAAISIVAGLFVGLMYLLRRLAR
ncbi:MAG: ABC transporter permease [Rubellimicrobium sp.]|nr:ABC transporter permease [Rubellimicrobium sp.]